VGKEMNLSEGVEALKTQVIAARTYAVIEQRLDRLRRVKGEKFDLYDDERSQMYGGWSATRDRREAGGRDARHVPRVRRQARRTFYSSACGGQRSRLGGDGGRDRADAPLAGTKCDYCQRRAIHRWKDPVVVSKKDIAERCLPKELQDKKVKTVEVTRTLPGGHALEVTLTLENSSRVVRLNATTEFKRALAEKFRSTLWDRIEDRGDSIAIIGRGYGHGAGLCQVGAYEMARDGKTASGSSSITSRAPRSRSYTDRMSRGRRRLVEGMPPPALRRVDAPDPHVPGSADRRRDLGPPQRADHQRRQPGPPPCGERPAVRRRDPGRLARPPGAPEGVRRGRPDGHRRPAGDPGTSDGGGSAVLDRIDPSTLLQTHRVQGFVESGLSILVHVVEHFSYHTGQLAYIVKSRKNVDLGFYRGRDLNKKG
jgi:SpoIID/LytB domain protein